MLTSEHPEPHAVLQPSSTPTHPSVPIVSVQEPFSPHDKAVLYAVLQDIANELRRIKREKRQNHQQES